MITILKTLVKVIYDNNFIHTDTSNSDGSCNGNVDQLGNDNANSNANGNPDGRVSMVKVMPMLMVMLTLLVMARTMVGGIGMAVVMALANIRSIS